MERSKIYFVADVHLGLKAGDPTEREERFVKWLRGIRTLETKAVWLLGDIWDFWYEYRDVIPREGFRVTAAISNLMDDGIEVYFIPGNHDIWLYSFWQNLGVKVVPQTQRMEAGGKRFCLGHGDGLGPGDYGYKFIRLMFHNRFLQGAFTCLHPWMAYRLGEGWSQRSRAEKPIAYTFKGADEPLYKYCLDFQSHYPVNFFLFGHYHSRLDMPVGPARLLILGDWMTASNWMVFDSETREIKAISGSGREYPL